MQPTQQKVWRAGRFWWDWPTPHDATMQPLRALVFDLDALADIECAGNRPAFNAAFASLGLDIAWSVPRYRQLLALRDERRRVAAELRKRGICTECDVLAELLVDEICSAKEMILGETILGADISPRPVLVDLITEAFSAGIGVGIVSTGRRSWVEPLTRHLVGDGVVGALVTADDAPQDHRYPAALSELGVTAHDALAFAGSHNSERAAIAGGLPTVLVDGDLDGAGAAVPRRVADCQRVHDTRRAPQTAA
ncbi:haloacid dehalogenase [Mycolicibacterium sp.]|uniref:haloacid dehalogenase n=1 Tax=Mycolicibacterium sp. TaxID=2320850 RepID=UPI003D13CF90